MKRSEKLRKIDKISEFTKTYVVQSNQNVQFRRVIDLFYKFGIQIRENLREDQIEKSHKIIKTFNILEKIDLEKIENNPKQIQSFWLKARMERDKPKFIGGILENEMNPTEKICDLLKCKNLHDLIKIFQKSDNAAEAIKESFIPLRK